MSSFFPQETPFMHGDSRALKLQIEDPEPNAVDDAAEQEEVVVDAKPFRRSSSSKHKMPLLGLRDGAPLISKWASSKLRKWVERFRNRRSEEGVQEEEREDALNARRSDEEIRPIYEAKCEDNGHPSSADGFTRFRSMFNLRNSRLDRVDVSGMGMGPEATRAIVRLINADRTVHTVVLAENSIGDTGAEHVADLLRKSRSLRFLDLSGCDLSQDGTHLIASALIGSAVEVLDISSGKGNKNTLGGKGAQALGEALGKTECALRQLRMSGVGPCPLAGFAHGLAANRSLRTLDIRANRIDDSSMAKLLNGVLKSRVQKLNISQNALYADGAKALLDLITRGSSVSYLNISSCITTDFNGLGMNDNVVQFGVLLRAALEDQACVLESLIMDDNTLRDEGAAAFLPALSNNNSLRHLSLASCGLSDTLNTTLVEAVSSNGALNELNLRDNRLGDAGIKAVADAMVHINGSVSGITVLNVGNNFCGNEAAFAVANMLGGNDCLQEINLAQNQIRDDGILSLIQALSGANANSSIHDIDVSLNNFSHSLARRMDRCLEYNRNQQRVEELKMYRKEVSRLKQDEILLHQTEQQIAELEEFVKSGSADRQVQEGYMEAWKAEQENETHQLSQHLAQLTHAWDAEMEIINNEKRVLEQELKNKRFEYTEKSTALNFKIANEKRRQYKRIEQLQKVRKDIATKHEEAQKAEAYQEELNKNLDEEVRTRDNVRSYLQTSKGKMEEFRGEVSENYARAMLQFRQEVVSAQVRVERLHGHSAPSFKWSRLDVPKFIQWYFSGEKRSPTASPRPSMHYISFHDEVPLLVRVTNTIDADAPHSIIIQRSHTVQSLCLHGFRPMSTVWVTLQGSAPQAAVEAEPKRIRVSGGTPVPNLIQMISDTLGISSDDIRQMYYDPNEDVMPDDTESVAPSAQLTNSSSVAETVNSGVENGSAIEMMKKVTDNFADFSSGARSAIDRIHEKLREFDRRYSLQLSDGAASSTLTGSTSVQSGIESTTTVSGDGHAFGKSRSSLVVEDIQEDDEEKPSEFDGDCVPDLPSRDAETLSSSTASRSVRRDRLMSARPGVRTTPSKYTGKSSPIQEDANAPDTTPALTRAHRPTTAQRSRSPTVTFAPTTHTWSDSPMHTSQSYQSAASEPVQRRASLSSAQRSRSPVRSPTEPKSLYKMGPNNRRVDVVSVVASGVAYNSNPNPSPNPVANPNPFIAHTATNNSVYSFVSAAESSAYSETPSATNAYAYAQSDANSRSSSRTHAKPSRAMPVAVIRPSVFSYPQPQTHEVVRGTAPKYSLTNKDLPSSPVSRPNNREGERRDRVTKYGFSFDANVTANAIANAKKTSHLGETDAYFGEGNDGNGIEKNIVMEEGEPHTNVNQYAKDNAVEVAYFPAQSASPAPKKPTRSVSFAAELEQHFIVPSYHEESTAAHTPATPAAPRRAPSNLSNSYGKSFAAPSGMVYVKPEGEVIEFARHAAGYRGARIGSALNRSSFNGYH